MSGFSFFLLLTHTRTVYIVRLMNTEHTTNSRKKDDKPTLDRFIVRAHLAMRRTTLAHWADAHGYNRNTVYLATKGFRHGPHSRTIVKTLRRELGL